jgi:hypothetical protein
VRVEQFAAVEVKDEDRHDEENDEGDSEEDDDEKEAGLVRANLFQLKVLQLMGEPLQAIGEMFRLARSVGHVVLDAVAYRDVM